MLFIGCNPVKQVLKDPAKLERIGRQWEKQNPCITPVTHVIPGKAVITRDTIPDTAAISRLTAQLDSFIEFQTDLFPYDQQVGVVKTGLQSILKKCNPVHIYHSRVDTLFKEDVRRLNIYNDSLNLYRGYRVELKLQLCETQLLVKQQKKRATKWMIYCLTLIALTILKYFLKIRYPKLSWL